MSEIEVIEIPQQQLLVAYEQAECECPEYTVWKRLQEKIASVDYPWADERFLGFNNPDGECGGEHGYEVWMTLSAAPGTFTTKDVAIGGRYAVTETHLTEIEASWGRLVKWLKETGATYDKNRQYLEEHIITQSQLDSIRDQGKFDEAAITLKLMLPIA